jgi:hypothetical protein
MTGAASWIALAVSALSVVVAAASLAMTIRTRRRQDTLEGRQQAMRVTCILDPRTKVLAVRNDSDAPVFDVVLLLEGDGTKSPREVYPLRPSTRVLAPSEKFTVDIDDRWAMPENLTSDAYPFVLSPVFDAGRHGSVGGRLLIPVVAFRDANGMRWKRTSFGELAPISE